MLSLDESDFIGKPHQADQAPIPLLHLHEADEMTADCSRFVDWWSRLAADQNWLSKHYRQAVATLLTREGYAVERQDTAGKQFPECLLRVAFMFKEVGITPKAIGDHPWSEIEAVMNQMLSEARQGSELTDELSDARDAVIAEESAAVVETPAPTAEQLENLEAKQRLTATQRRMIERGRLQRDLGISEPTAEQVAVSRKQSYGKLRQHLLMVDADYRQRAQKQTVQGMTLSQRRFAPDATKAMASITRATVMSQLHWLQDLIALAGTGQTIVTGEFYDEHFAAQDDRQRWRELFGFDPGNEITPRTFLNNMLKLLGFKLKRTDRRERIGKRIWWHYEVVDELKALNRSQAHATMREALQ